MKLLCYFHGWADVMCFHVIAVMLQNYKFNKFVLIEYFATVGQDSFQPSSHLFYLLISPQNKVNCWKFSKPNYRPKKLERND